MCILEYPVGFVPQQQLSCKLGILLSYQKEPVHENPTNHTKFSIKYIDHGDNNLIHHILFENNSLGSYIEELKSD